jgi:hypothetical protein
MISELKKKWGRGSVRPETAMVFLLPLGGAWWHRLSMTTSQAHRRPGTQVNFFATRGRVVGVSAQVEPLGRQE